MHGESTIPALAPDVDDEQGCASDRQRPRGDAEPDRHVIGPFAPRADRFEVVAVAVTDLLARVAVHGVGLRAKGSAVDAADLRVDYPKHNGASNGPDRVQALDCEYLCAWAGAESVDGAVQWIAGLFRG